MTQNQNPALTAAYTKMADTMSAAFVGIMVDYTNALGARIPSLFGLDQDNTTSANPTPAEANDQSATGIKGALIFVAEISSRHGMVRSLLVDDETGTVSFDSKGVHFVYNFRRLSVELSYDTVVAVWDVNEGIFRHIDKFIKDYTTT